MDDANRDEAPAIAGDLPDEWQRLEDQLAWYGRRSRDCRRWHKGVRLVQVVFAAAIPVISLADLLWARWLTATLGALIAVLEAFEQINQFGPLWIQYRSTAESLKHEKFLLLAGAGPYRDLARGEALRLLAERVEERVSREHARWVHATTETVATPAAEKSPTTPQQ
ncbi:hypothetical protein BOX17_10750 [Halomonas aestuarii]|uniref:DUF4231 domain-containing protein n=1 Tax=Halomonas aestuarii TaxID=1897729 RepID=A0A1J0VH81_9GAMM|nr:DUF4231 domain-containing protein [Halomonas aestuarii]APE31384.1 hypothetical protein BOX17_10750 [Halomonas aestuarii]